MPFDISGVFSRLYSWVNDRDTGVKINAPRMDAEFNGVKDAINAIVGQTQPFINPVRAPNGTAAAPAYTFDGDQGNGFYRIGPNQMGLAQGGVGLGQVFARGNILGAVSQSWGVPTGAVMEGGINANGDFIRFANGLQICWRFAIPGTLNAAGTVWTFPSSFFVAPSVLCIPEAEAARFATHSDRTTASVKIYQWDLTGAGKTDRGTQVIAIGHWF